MTTQQVESATVIGTVTGTGNATVTITARDMANSPLAVSVAVTNGDTASVVGGLIRTALAFNASVAAAFLVSGSGANVVLTSHLAQANDSTLNIAIANGTCTGLTAAPTSTNTTAGVGLSNAYCTIAEVNNDDVLKKTGTDHHDVLAKTINGASRMIDRFCGQRFYSVSETRYYTAKKPYKLRVDGIASTSGVSLYTDLDGDGTYESIWASTDYNLSRYNSALDGEPFTSIETTLQGQFTFPSTRKGVKITAPFGWAEVPADIVTACILHVNYTWSLYKAPVGVVGASAIGTMTVNIPELSPEVQNLLAPFRKRV